MNIKSEDEKAAHRDRQKILKDLINQSIMPCKAEDRAGRMAEQAELLDLTFRQCLSDATYYNSSRLDFAIALKMQNQCRQTMQFLNILESRKKDGKGQPKT